MTATRANRAEYERGISWSRAIAVVYTLFLIFAAGTQFLLLACVLLAPATLLYGFARREQGAKLFTRPGWVVFIVVLAGAVAGVIGLITGFVTI